jgi:zinc protease
MTRIFKRAFMPIVGLWLLIQLPASAQNQQTVLPTDPHVKIGKLENGFTYYIRENARPENKLELRLVINAGSILEDDDQQGLAHFTEHMAFNGSKNFEKNEMVSFLQTIGVEFGADLNAYTSFDETVYILPIPTEKKENVEKAFQILEDWASAISFDEVEINKERGVVLEEERLGKGAEERMFRVTYPKIFEGSKYANRLPIGKAAIIQNFQPELIRKFYRDWYRPDLMAVIAVGDYPVAEVERLIKTHFDQLPNPQPEKVRSVEGLQPRKKSEGLVVTDKEATNHIVEIYYDSRRDTATRTVSDFRKYLIEALCRNMLSQRLQELTQKPQPPFLFGASSLSGLVRGYKAFTSFAYVSQQGVKAAISALIQENEKARQFGFTTTELERLKKMFMKNIERSFNERDKSESSSFVDDYINHFLEGEAIAGVENEYQLYKELLEGISLEEVNREASRMIPSSDVPKLVILTGPDSADFAIPTNNELLSMADDAASQQVSAYEDKVIATTLLESRPKEGAVVSNQYNEKLGTTNLDLSNGIHVILKPTDFKNDQVVMSGSRLGGQYLYDTADRFNAEYASVVVSQMGVGSFSPLDIRKVLAGKNASVSTRIGSVSESFSGQCSSTDVEAMFQLLYLYFTAPRKDVDLFTSFVTKQQSYYQNMAHDPEYVFQDSVFKVMYAKHPWAPKLPTVETFSRINVDRALEIYRERFGNAYGFTVVVAGAFDVGAMQSLVKTYLGSLPSAKYNPRFRDVNLRPVSGNLKVEVKKGSEPKSLVKIFWNGEAKFSPTEQFKLQLFADVVNIKLTERLREDLGNIYSGGVYASLNKFPYHNYSIVASLPCAPENVEQVTKVLFEELEKIKKDGPPEKDLNKVKEAWKQQHLVNLKENAYWVRQLLQSVENNTDPSRIFATSKEVETITVSEIRKVANRYVNMENLVQFVLNPE